MACCPNKGKFLFHVLQMISAEAPVLFAKAAEIFISELSLRAWIHTEDNKRRTLQVNIIRELICPVIMLCSFISTLHQTIPCFERSTEYIAKMQMKFIYL